MEETKKKQVNFGLLGRNISYSFSRGYFAEKFKILGLKDHVYRNYDIQDIAKIDSIINKTAGLKGLNVTIPYKEVVIPYLDKLSPSAAKIGAVNTIKVTPAGLIGYNTDAYGFQRSIEHALTSKHKFALILGTGGASKAVAYVLESLGIAIKFVSRTKNEHCFTYADLNKHIIEKYTIIINCSPVGTFPKILDKPAIPYAHITNSHVLFDLIYNPEKTAFLAEGANRGATVLNGAKMLELQAEKAWEIWNEPS